MIRLFFRTVGVAFLVLALAAVALDAAQSIAASAPRLTAIDTALATVSPRLSAGLESAARDRLGSGIFDGAVRPFLTLPASVVLTGAGFLLLFGGAPRRRHRPIP